MRLGLKAMKWRLALPLAALPVAALLMTASGCAHYGGRGGDLYYQGRYIEAAHVLEKTEPQLTAALPLEQASYGLYRGATLLRLGDLEGAMRWLEYCRRLEATRPGVLRADQLELLQESLIALRADLDRRAAAGGY
jgi:hypothetical protein